MTRNNFIEDKDKHFQDENVTHDDSSVNQAYNDELWTIEYFVDELFFSLVQVTELITNSNGKTLRVKKYYLRARRILELIPIYRPPPIFSINISDLSQRIIDEIEDVTDDKSRTYVLTQGCGRIFENLDFEYYHLSIARNLRVGLER